MIERLEALLQAGSEAELIQAFTSSWLNDLIPGMKLLVGCNQDPLRHAEGDVAAHTVLVIENLRRVVQRRCSREADKIELLAALVHDLKKPDVRAVDSSGVISFPDHEAAAAAAVPEIGQRLGLTQSETDRLYFVVANHGHAWDPAALSDQTRREIGTSEHLLSLACLQEADALSGIRASGECGPIRWAEILTLKGWFS